MNEIVPFHSVTLATAGCRPDIRAMMQHFTAPYRAAVPFQDLIETVKRNSTPSRRSKNQRLSAAIAIHNAVAGHVDAVSKARDALGIAMLAPDEADVRQILGAMMLVFHAPPTETASFFVDALVMELREPEVDRPYSLPAIAAAARELWRTLPSPPSIADFLPCVKKHQTRIEAVFQQLVDILEAADWAEDQIKPEKPPVWNEDDPDFIPF
jgi:hypothetical protein